jgi:hypothetical protein
MIPKHDKYSYPNVGECWNDGIRGWLINGIFYREDGIKEWWDNDKCHREDGPAVIGDGILKWYLNFKKYKASNSKLINFLLQSNKEIL